jgi:hypothetical protein
MEMGKKHLKSQNKWMKKVQSVFEETQPKSRRGLGGGEDSPNITETTSALPPPVSSSANPKDLAQRYQSIRLFQSMVETQKSEDEKILARQSFGPYKALELLQFFDLYQLMTKRVPTAHDILLTASSKEEEVGNGLITAGVGTTDPGAGGYGAILLHEFLKHKYLRSRPQLKTIFEKNLIISQYPTPGGGVGSSSGGVAATGVPLPTQHHGHILITLQRIIQQMCPLMTPNDRRDCLRYFSLVTVERQKQQEEQQASYAAKFMTPKQLKQLRAIFSYFDLDQNGTVNRTEIKRAMKRDYLRSDSNHRMGGDDGLKGSDQLIETGVDDASIESMVEEADADGNNELDFEEFVKLFGATFQT